MVFILGISNHDETERTMAFGKAKRFLHGGPKHGGDDYIVFCSSVFLFCHYKKRFIKFRLSLITGHKKPGQVFHLVEQSRISFNSRLMQRFYDVFGLGGSPLNGNHLLNIRIILVQLIHAFSYENCLFHSRGRRHHLSGEYLHIIPGLPLPGVTDGR